MRVSGEDKLRCKGRERYNDDRGRRSRARMEPQPRGIGVIVVVGERVTAGETVVFV